MPFSTRLDHPQRLVVFHTSGQFFQNDLDSVLTLFRHPQFPASYDLLTLFDPDVSMDLGHTALVDHAIERERTLQERTPERAIRSALADVPVALAPMLELWPLFFPASKSALSVRVFDTMGEALDWLERRPFDFDSLPRFPSPPTE